MKTSILKYVALAGVLGLLAGCSEAEPEAKGPRPIRSVVVEIRSIGETVSQTGEIRPRYETPMSFRLDGQLTFRVENGVEVKAGALLASIDKVPAQNDVRTARAELATARSALEFARLTAERNRELFSKTVISRAQLQEAEANLQAAQARFEAATTALSKADETLTYTEIKALRDGIVSAVGANVGQIVQAGQPVVTLLSNQERDAVFDVPERLLHSGAEATEVQVSLISNPEATATGTVREVTPSADPITRTFRVKVSLDGKGQDMPFGAAVLGTIVLSPKLLVELPASALTSNNGATAVFVFDTASGKLSYRTVQIDRYDDRAIYVSSGLETGDIVATAGVSKLRDGEAVKLETEEAR
ncbi:RND family efflux transporter, MFP subunit [Rhizobium sp. RU20A]|uniref:efflux RND transporter periplasmic adaptor subunit n=1 Tax=Rhizobium sp. RU20A TaxID=1907412 RepID=UPI0009547CCD|nr:efflux RND transporter periplasmic adaptor subunit [Rhizobium sp. RU20A]SIR24873.1 RND family efflux transporter, MFP subunit [Rhizobium sp. RU20A]